MIVGNKSDMKSKFVVSEKEAREFAQGLMVDFFLTSAKSGSNVKKVFKHIM